MIPRCCQLFHNNIIDPSMQLPDSTFFRSHHIGISNRPTAQPVMRFLYLALPFLLFMVNASAADSGYPLSRRSLKHDSNPVLLPVEPTLRAPNSTNVFIAEAPPGPAPIADMPADADDENAQTDTDRGPSLAQACKSAEDDKVYGTRNSFVVTYIFELETTSDPILESRSIQTKLIRYLLQALMLESGLCDDYMKKSGDRKLVQVLDGLWGVGSVSHPTILSINCRGNSESKNCFRMMGSVVLYFDESISSISYKAIKDTVLPLIYNNDVDVGSSGLSFQSEDETDLEEQQPTKDTVSGVAAAEPEILPQRRSGIGPAGIFITMVMIICFTVGLGYLLLRKYFVVIRRPTDVYAKNLGASDDVSSIGVTQALSPYSSTSDHLERFRVKDTLPSTTNRDRGTRAAVDLDDVSSDEEQPSSPYDIRLESVSDPEILTLDQDGYHSKNDRQRKQYVRHQRELNRPRRKKSIQGYMPDTVEL